MVSQLILSLKKRKNYYSSKLKILSPAKLNLCLNIIGKYQRGKFKGYHCLESVVERVSLFDIITIEITEKNSIKFSCTDKTLENKNNLCVRAASLIKTAYNIPFGFKIHLKKNIPVGSGLGGGSSNAASVLLGINKLLNLQLNRRQFYQLGGQLGSDVNFFLADTSFAVMTGRGEVIKPFSGVTFYHEIMWNGLHLSTKKVYDNVNINLTNIVGNVILIKKAIKTGNTALLQENIFNGLKQSAFLLSKELSETSAYLNNKGIANYMTGSGSAFFTVLSSSGKRGKAVPISVKGILPPNWKIFAVKTF
jgi:4-diphosphocytidyl-2-C-methyl-D-erythritol kinase